MAERNSLNANAKRVAENEEINEWEAGNIGRSDKCKSFPCQRDVIAGVVGMPTTITAALRERRERCFFNEALCRNMSADRAVWQSRVAQAAPGSTAPDPLPCTRVQ